VQPVIPAAWAGFSATRRFRGTIYEIEVRRAHPGTESSSGSGEIVVDGRPIEGSVVPLPEPGSPVVHVEVRLA
jgi:cellobiose phosphorylase